ncbi:MAG TPA: hypothetical protein VMR25_15950 [Planctomycetaceae bacterium]|jgi:hypothetical protein|nr:hypothetical protein [Planctomycetaceae bacterium]
MSGELIRAILEMTQTGRSIPLSSVPGYLRMQFEDSPCSGCIWGCPLDATPELIEEILVVGIHERLLRDAVLPSEGTLQPALSKWSANPLGVLAANAASVDAAQRGLEPSATARAPEAPPTAPAEKTHKEKEAEFFQTDTKLS